MIEKGTMLRFIDQPHVWEWSMDLTPGKVYEVKDIMDNAPCIIDNINEPVLLFPARIDCFEVVEREPLLEVGTVLTYIGAPFDRWCSELTKGATYTVKAHAPYKNMQTMERFEKVPIIYDDVHDFVLVLPERLKYFEMK